MYCLYQKRRKNMLFQNKMWKSSLSSGTSWVTSSESTLTKMRSSLTCSEGQTPYLRSAGAQSRKSSIKKTSLTRERQRCSRSIRSFTAHLASFLTSSACMRNQTCLTKISSGSVTPPPTYMLGSSVNCPPSKAKMVYRFWLNRQLRNWRKSIRRPVSEKVS